MYWRRSTETSLGVSFETYLRRHWDVQRDVVTTSLQRLVAGWDVEGECQESLIQGKIHIQQNLKEGHKYLKSKVLESCVIQTYFWQYGHNSIS